MDCICPFEYNLECTQIQRMDEFYRCMENAMMTNSPVYFLTGGQCPVSRFDCEKLRNYQERIQKQR